MSPQAFSLLIASCWLAGCGSPALDELPDAASPDAASPWNPPACDGSDIVVEWRPEGDVVPSVTVQGDGFYGLADDDQNDAYDLQRYDAQGLSSVTATLPAPPGTSTSLFVRDDALHYVRTTDAVIHHGPIAGSELVVTTGGRRVVNVQAADQGGLFVAFRDISRDEYFYTIYDGSDERVTEPFTSDSSVHPRPGALPVIARLTTDRRLLAGVAGEPMIELLASPSCPATPPYAVVALGDGALSWAHACPPDNQDVRSFLAVRSPSGETVWRTLSTGAESVSLSEGPGGTILAAFLVEPGELALHLFDTLLRERSRGTMSVADFVTVNDTVYELPLTAVSLSQATIGPVFTITGRFNLPDGHVTKLAFGTLCP